MKNKRLFNIITKMMISFLLLIVLQAFSAVEVCTVLNENTSIVFENDQGDMLKVTSIRPSQNELPFYEKVYVEIEYELKSADYCQIWARGYKNGKSHHALGSSGSTFLSGKGTTVQWFHPYKEDSDWYDIDQIRLTMRVRNDDGSSGAIVLEEFVNVEYIWKKSLVEKPTLDDLKDYLGTWRNIDKATDGITKFRIFEESDGVYVSMWGKCHPTDCEWGSTKADLTKLNQNEILLTWNKSFVKREQVLTLMENGMIKLSGHSDYFDSRNDRYDLYYFTKTNE